MAGERSIRAVRAKRLAALVLGLLALGAGHGPTCACSRIAPRVRAREHAGPGPRPRPRAGAASSHGPSVSAALPEPAAQRRDHRSELPARTTAIYLAAKCSLGRLSGTRRAELAAVLANVQAIAAAGELIPSRLRALFLTLERNRAWWTTEPLLVQRTSA